MEQIIAGVIASTITAGAVIIIAGIGELMAERSGVINLGLDGIMSVGALVAIIVVNTVVPNIWFGLAAAMVAGLVMGGIFAVITVTIKADQYLSGLALGFLGAGLSGEIGRSYVGVPARARFIPIEFPVLSNLPFFGRALFSHNVITYCAYIILPLLASYLLYRTRHGLNVRAVGQNPKAADSRGIQVDYLRFFYQCLNGALTGAAGAYLTLSLTPSWANNVVAGRGWIAITLVIFANWNPIYLVIGAMLFGAATSLGFVVQIQGWGIPTPFLFMFPYLITLFLMLMSYFVRKRRGIDKTSIGPAALGQPYSRE